MNTQVITFDTETTGLLSDPKARVIEIGAVKHDLETGEIIDIFQSFSRPDKRFLTDKHWDICKRISNIDRKKIEEAEPYFTPFINFMNWCGKDLVFAWNLPFDYAMMARSLSDGIALWRHTPGLSFYSLELMKQYFFQIRWGGCWQHLYTFQNGSPEFGRSENGLVLHSLKYAIKDAKEDICIGDTVFFGPEVNTENQSHRALEDARWAAHVAHRYYHHSKRRD